MSKGKGKELKIGAFFLVGVFAVLAVLEFVGSPSFASGSREVSIYFDSVAGLEEGALVKMEGVRVGNVRSIGFSEDGRGIKVRVAVRKDAPLTEDSVASVKLSSLLGSSYVNLSIGDPDSPPLPHGASINGDAPHDFDKIIQDAGELMESASMAVARLNSILKKVDEGEGAVGKLVNEDDLYVAAKDAILKAHTSLDTIEDLAPVSFIATVLGVAGTFY